jgi:hypothetical protein
MYALILSVTGLVSVNTTYRPEPALATSTFPFYSELIEIQYDPSIIIEEPARIDNLVLRKLYRQLQSRNSTPLFDHLIQEKERLQLNDFLFFKLAKDGVNRIYGGRSERAQTMVLFYLLNRAGFDVRLTFRDQRLYLNVYSEDELFEVPIIRDGGRAYANISCLDGSCLGRRRLYISDLHPNQDGGRPFQFSLRHWPRLRAQPVEKIIGFQYRGVEQQLPVQFDQTIVDIMADYPFLEEYCYLDTPLSPTLSASLLPPLRRWLSTRNQRQQLELLVSLTRSGFRYREDTKYFGRSKPMVPEEVFSYPYSDCEDRSALFFALVRDLIDLPMVVIAYTDHLSVAVAADQVAGEGFTYQGRRYVFCDPTGPANSSAIGSAPPGYENEEFQIIGQYK